MTCCAIVTFQCAPLCHNGNALRAVGHWGWTGARCGGCRGITARGESRASVRRFEDRGARLAVEVAVAERTDHHDLRAHRGPARAREHDDGVAALDQRVRPAAADREYFAHAPA